MPEGSGGGSLGDVIVSALEALILKLVDPIADVIEGSVNALIETIVGTPYPNAVFSPPTNKAWPDIYAYYGDVIVPLSLFLWAGSIGLVILLETTSHLFSSYHRSKLKKRAFAGLLGVLAWWWMAALSLRFVHQLATLIAPELSEITLFETLSFGSMGVLGTALALLSDFVLFGIIALIYLLREYVLYLFVLLMPILIVLWIPGVGPFALVSRFVRRLAGFYVPFLFMTVPVAVLFRLGELLGSSVGSGSSGFWLWLSAIVIPVLAVVIPLIMVWQAGAVFFIADRAAHHMSAQRARHRLSRAREGGRAARSGGGNFVRGLRAEPPVDRDGQYKLGHGGSRAHAAGSRLRTITTRVREAGSGLGDWRRRGGGGSGGSGGSSDGSGGETGGRDGRYSRTNDFETLRERGGDRDEERPYYID